VIQKWHSISTFNGDRSVTVDCQILRILDGVEFSISSSNTAFRPNALWKYNCTRC
jgi:hypothetical protein